MYSWRWPRLLVSGCATPHGQPSKDSEVLAPNEVLEFATLYAENCAACHGPEGRGGAAIALNNPVYLAIADDAAIRKVILKGVPGTAMPAFAQSAGGMLTDAQIDVITKEIRSRWSKQGMLDAATVPSYAPKSIGDAQRGEVAYKTFCESCHGPGGAGGSKGSAITNDSFLALVSDQGLRTIVITGRPELGAPDWRGNVPGRPMSDQEVTDVVAWLASHRVSNPGSLTQLRITYSIRSRKMSDENNISRRGLFMKLGILFNGLVATALAVPIVRFLSSSVTRGRAGAYLSWVPLGRVNEFPEGETRLATFRNPYVMPTDGKTVDTACWVRRIEGEQFQVFAVNCAHLGCPVRWFPQSGLFMCPCHGGAYYRDGSRASGPPERGLFEYPHKMQDGMITIQAGNCPHRARAPLSSKRNRHAPLSSRSEQWFDRRLQLAAPIREVAEHPVPRNTASWWYVFGSAALTVFLLQLVTGILLALIYVPSASEAWSSLQALNHDIALGWFIRAMHGWGSNFMVAIVLIHMVQVFLFGAHKFPRELTWILGVFLLLMTLGMAFSGQVLRFDQDAYWGLGIGASIASRVPIAGPAIVKLMLGGPIIAGATLSRFFALHVFVIPGMLIGFVCIASFNGRETGHQRMAHARACSEARDLHERVS